MGQLEALRAQRTPIPYPETSFTGQTVIVTGSNQGLGLEAARHIVRLNATRVILAVRTISKGEMAKASIEESTGRKGVVEVWHLDMNDYDSIIAFAKKAEGLDRLDAVIENAGVLIKGFQEQNGVELTIRTNVIGTFLLALNLFPILRRSGKATGETARLTIVSSIMHESAKFAERHEASIFEAFKKNNKAYIQDRYSVSKLLEVLLIRSLANAIEKGPHASEPLILNNVNPGLCHSELDKDVTGLIKYGLTLAKALIARTTEVGSRTLVHAAAAGKETHGQYLSECKVKQPSAWVRSKEGEKTQERVHKELMDILEEIQPGVTSNI